MSSTKPNYNFYLTLLAVIVVVLGHWLVIVPQFRMSREDNGKIIKVVADTQAASARLDAIKRLDQAIKANQQGFDLLTLALPKDGDVGGVLVALDALTAKSGVSVVSIDPAKADAATGFLPVSIHIQGEYGNIITFMNALQNHIRPISVQTMTITKLAESSALDVTFALQLTFSPPVKSENQVANQPTVSVNGQPTE